LLGRGGTASAYRVHDELSASREEHEGLVAGVAPIVGALTKALIESGDLFGALAA
jgi:hypothetical protein